MNSIRSSSLPSTSPGSAFEALPVFELYLLKEGETFPSKSIELARNGIRTGTIDEIQVWLGDGAVAFPHAPIVIADPKAKPDIFCADLDWPIIQVSAYGIEGRGKPFSRGAIDLHVPMRSRTAGGQLAVLGIKQ